MRAYRCGSFQPGNFLIFYVSLLSKSLHLLKVRSFSKSFVAFSHVVGFEIVIFDERFSICSRIDHDIYPQSRIINSHLNACFLRGKSPVGLNPKHELYFWKLSTACNVTVVNVPRYTKLKDPLVFFNDAIVNDCVFCCSSRFPWRRFRASWFFNEPRTNATASCSFCAFPVVSSHHRNEIETTNRAHGPLVTLRLRIAPVNY